MPRFDATLRNPAVVRQQLAKEGKKETRRQIKARPRFPFRRCVVCMQSKAHVNRDGTTDQVGRN